MLSDTARITLDRGKSPDAATMTFVWLLTALTWVGHVGLLFVPVSAVSLIVTGQAERWINLSIFAALIPQLIVVPWAWVDCGRHELRAGYRFAWRTLFFFTGFIGVSAYALLHRTKLFSGR